MLHYASLGLDTSRSLYWQMQKPRLTQEAMLLKSGFHLQKFGQDNLWQPVEAV
jgi:hypothetical protein